MKKLAKHEWEFKVFHFSKKAFHMIGFTTFVKNEEEVPYFWQKLMNARKVHIAIRLLPRHLVLRNSKFICR